MRKRICNDVHGVGVGYGPYMDAELAEKEITREREENPENTYWLEEANIEKLLIELDEISIKCIEEDSPENRDKLIYKMEECLLGGVSKEKVTHVVEAVASLHKKN